MKVKTGVVLAGLIAAAVAAWYVYKGGKKLVTETLNPASDKNAAYTAVNEIGAVVTGDASFSLGSAIYNATHGTPDNFNETQAAKTCAVLFPQNGPRRAPAGSICAGLGY